MKNVVLGVTGGIAAYKACEIVSSLTKKNINVDVVMTKNATEFVSPLTFMTLSKNVVNTDTFANIKYYEVEHIELAKKADLLVIAPATANIIAKLANGIADDMLSTVALATKSQILIAPAMNTNMYENTVTVENTEKLKKRGVKFIEPKFGLLACQDIGKGKLADVDDIVERIEYELGKTCELKGKKITVTAGGTIEDIDPVRYITNNSSGKMGYAIARQAVYMGADVTLISAKTNLKKPYGLYKYIEVRSAGDMYEAVMREYEEADIVVKAAAVADFTPMNYAERKIKKTQDDLKIELKRTKDILKTLGENKKNQFLAGFAAETENVEEYAKNKMKTKNLDMIVANNVASEGAGFNADTNIAEIFFKDNTSRKIEKMPKQELAKIILRCIAEKLSRHDNCK